MMFCFKRWDTSEKIIQTKGGRILQFYWAKIPIGKEECCEIRSFIILL